MNHYLYITFLLTVLAVYAAKNIDTRIVAKRGQFPWQVGVVTVKDYLVSYCGGAIIAKDWILTAAHCIYEADSVVIMYDTLDLEDTNNKVQVTKDFVVHKNYDPQSLKNDIGLVHLGTPLTFNTDVSAIALSTQQLQPNTKVTVIGWGTNDGHSNKFNILRYANVTTIDNERCSEVYGTTAVINDGVVCTDPGNPVTNPCKGGGGDPVVLYGRNGPELVAVFSSLSRSACKNGGIPARYTRTAFYRSWIRNVTGL